MKARLQKLAERYGRKTDIGEIIREIIEQQYHTGAFSNPQYPIITAEEEIQVFQWGLIPFWTRRDSDAQEVRRMTYNAKAETVFDKPSFREPILSKRCLVPSTGYFEYHHNEDGSTTPFYIYLLTEEIFSLAGIYDIWVNRQTGEIFQTFSVITTEANPFTAAIHNGGKNPRRMPVILSPEDEGKWLDPDLSKFAISELLKPFDEKQMDAYPVRSDFIKKNPHDKTILEKAS